MKILELFGGISALRAAFNKLIDANIINKNEYELVDFVENDTKVVDVYNLMYDEKQIPKDVRTYSYNKDDQIDILLHGSPCQDFSVAGKNLGGVENSNTRSSLLWETIRIVKEMKYKPKIIIWENVANVISKKHKDVFDKYINVLDELGYKSTYKVLNAVDFGIPQKRKRVFTISILNDEAFDWNYLENEIKDINMQHLKDFIDFDLAEDKYFCKINLNFMIKALFNGKIKIVEDNVYTIITNQMRWNNAGLLKIAFSTFNQENYIFDVNNYNCYLPTLTASGANSRIKLLIKKDYIFKDNKVIFLIDNKAYYLRIISPKESLKLMGFDEKYYNKIKHLKDSILYHVSGNSIVVDILENILKVIFKYYKN